VEAAFALPLLVSLLFGILVYGSWFMTAHCIQQAANDAARTAMAGLNDTERRALVDSSVTASLANAATVRIANVVVTTAQANSYYTVTLTYNLANVPLFAASPFPMPGTLIQRDAVVRLQGA
jgi:Flp pilus assembly protein TadG